MSNLTEYCYWLWCEQV